MTVLKVRHMHSEGSEDENGPKYVVKYWVQTDSRSDGPFTVRSAVPWVRGDAYILGNDADPLARVASISERPLSSSHYLDWEVTVEFGNRENENESPLAEPMKESWGHNTKARKFYRDRNGQVIRDPVGVPYADGIEEDDLLPTINYTINLAVFPHAVALQVRNATNSSAWKLFGARTVRISSMPADREFHPKFGVYYTAGFGFAIDPDGVQPQILARSHFYKDGAKIKRFLEGNPVAGNNPVQGFPSSQPYMVDVNGLPTNNPYYQTVELRPQLDFNSLFSFLV